MEIHTRTVGDVHVLDLSGKITLGAATIAIRHTISDLLVNGGRKIILNLRDVNYIDSAGIGELQLCWSLLFGHQDCAIFSGSHSGSQH